LLQHGTENRTDELFEVGHDSHVLNNGTLLEDEALIITENDIIEFKNRLIMY
jgi:hypothetical protein